MNLLMLGSLLSLIVCTSPSKAFAGPIPNGIEIAESDYPAVVSILIYGVRGAGLCSGTYISRHVVLTAGHCVVDTDTGAPIDHWEVRTRDGTYKTKKGYPHPFYVTRKGPLAFVDPRYDLGVLITTEEGPHSIPVATGAPRVKQGVTLVGYGRDETEATWWNDTFFNGGAGKKRYGYNVVGDVSEDSIAIFGLMRNKEALGFYDVPDAIFAGISNGDSGGPMISYGKVIGVASSGAGASLADIIKNGRVAKSSVPEWLQNSNLNDYTVTFHVRTDTEAAQIFIDSFVGRPNLR